jgi:hypothetical protein
MDTIDVAIYITASLGLLLMLVAVLHPRGGSDE